MPKRLTIGPQAKPPPRKPLKQPPRKPELFEQLFPCAWRGITIPVSSIRVTLTQDHAEHKYYGVDSASVEATGRAPLAIEAHIPFLNGIVPGKNEHWGALYPTVFREFLDAFADKSTGVFNHPELSGISCKPVSLDFHHEAQRRDGVEVTARWIETIDPDSDLTGPFTHKSPIEATDAITDLDASLADIRGLAPDMPVFQESFTSMLAKVRGFADITAAEITAIRKTPASMLHDLERVKQSAESLHSAMTARLDTDCARSEELLRDYKENQTKVASRGRVIFRYITQTRTTLCALLGILKRNTLDDLVKLNPSLLSRVDVPPFTAVRFYA